MTLLDLLEQPDVKGDGTLQRLARHFLAHPHEWIDGRDLERYGGRYAWRSRVSDARRRYGMQIDNRQRRVHSLAGTTYTVSEYRYQPQPSHS